MLARAAAGTGKEITGLKTSLKENIGVAGAHASLNDTVVAIIARLLGMKPAEININETLEQYGFDSMLAMQLFQQLQSQADPSLDSARLQGCGTIQDIIHVLSAGLKEKPAFLVGQTMISPRTHRSQFPELVHLNQWSDGRPVFWLHPI